jgi:heme exporter protein D
MYFDSFQDLLTMSGHGVFVWACYAIVLLGLTALALYPLQKKRKVFAAIKQRRMLAEENQ